MNIYSKKKTKIKKNKLNNYCIKKKVFLSVRTKLYCQILLTIYPIVTVITFSPNFIGIICEQKTLDSLFLIFL